MWFFGPVFVKELLEIARRGRYYFARMSLGIVILLVLWLIPADARTYGLHEAATYGHSMFIGWLWTQFCLLALLTPTLVGGLVSGERDRNSLELLFTTDLRDREILWGKLASRLLVVGLILLSSLPVIVLLSLFGGIDYTQLLSGTCVTVSITALAGSIGLYFSVITAKPWIAMLRTYWLGMVLWFFLPFLSGLMLELFFRNGPGSASTAEYWFLWGMFLCHPLFDLALLTEPGAPIPISPGLMIPLSSSLWLAAATAIFSLACYRLRSAAVIARPPLTWRIVRRLAPTWRHDTTSRGGRAGPAVWRWRLSLLRSPRWREQLLEWNPIVFRNAHASIYDSHHHLSTIQFLGMAATIALLLLTFLASRSPLGTGEFTFAATVQMIGLHLVLVIVAAGSVSRERETGTLDLLLTTSITPTQIVLGHFQGVLAAVAPTIVLVLSTLVLGYLAGAYTSVSFLAWYALVLASQTLSIVAGALLLSVACRRVGTATSLALVAPLWLWFGSTLFVDSTDKAAVGPLALVGIVMIAAPTPLLFARPAWRLAGAVMLAITVPVGCVGSLAILETDTMYPHYAFTFIHWLTALSFGPFFGVGRPQAPTHWDPPSGLDDVKLAFIGGNLLASVVLLAIAAGLFPRLIGRHDRS